MNSYKGLTINVEHTDGKISCAKLLKGRSGIPENLLEDLNQILSNTFAKPVVPVQTIVAIGDLAEHKVFAHLKQIAQTSELEVFDRSSEAGHGDLSVSYKGINICIEVKNYKTVLPQVQINKYYQSLEIEEYHAGILICMQSHGFTKAANIHTPIDIQYYKNKPCIFIAGVDLDILYPIITIIHTMIQSSDTSQVSIDELITRIETIKEKIAEMKSLVATHKKITDKLEKALGEISLI